MSVKLFSQEYLTIDSAINIAIMNDIMIKKNHYLKRDQELELEYLNKSRFPNLSFSFYQQLLYGLAFDQVSGKLIAENKFTNVNGPSISSSLVLFEGFKRRHAIKSQNITIEKTTINEQLLRRDLIINVVKLFHDFLARKDIFNYHKERKTFFESELKLARKEVEIGVRNISDTLIMRALFENNVKDLVDAEMNYKIGLINFCSLIGIPLNYNLDLRSNEELSLLEEDNKIDIESIFSNSPEYKLSVIESRFLEKNIDINKASLWPRVSVSMNLGTNYSSQYRNQILGTSLFDQYKNNRIHTTSLNISYPIFDGKRRSISVKQAKLDLKESKEKAVDDKRKFEALIETLLVEHSRNKAVYLSNNRIFDLNSRYFSKMLQKQSMKEIPSMSLIEINRQMNESKVNLIKSKFEVIITKKILEIFFAN